MVFEKKMNMLKVNIIMLLTTLTPNKFWEVPLVLYTAIWWPIFRPSQLTLIHFHSPRNSILCWCFGNPTWHSLPFWWFCPKLPLGSVAKIKKKPIHVNVLIKGLTDISIKFIKMILIYNHWRVWILNKKKNIDKR